MSTFLTLAAAWAGTSAVVIAALVWTTREETPTEPPHAHDPADCDVCCWASDGGVIAAIDFDRWAAEMQERAS